MTKGSPVDQEKAITLGHPSYVWGFGQERRLDLIRRSVSLDDQAILDVGCGLGMYVRAFRRFSQNVHGVDVDAEKASQASHKHPNICVAPAEDLPYRDGAFDLVLSHEVIEHVADDRRALEEAIRVLREPVPDEGKMGGRLVVFAPNRLYPFETHGAYWRGRYHYGNIPLINYLPNRWRRRFCPHVRAYTRSELRHLIAGQPVRVVLHTQVFPGYDKLASHWPALGQILRRLTYAMERTPLRRFGLSHLLVAERIL